MNVFCFKTEASKNRIDSPASSTSLTKSSHFLRLVTSLDAMFDSADPNSEENLSKIKKSFGGRGKWDVLKQMQCQVRLMLINITDQP